MHIRLIAVGDRQPAWVDDAVATFVARLPGNWRFRIDELPTARRNKGESAGRAVAAESRSIVDRLGASEQLVLLDETGRQLTSALLARQVGDWQADGRDLAFVIGGPDGVHESLKAKAAFRWSLSRLTLPHGLARIVCVEQLYRAWSLLAGHPYHRE